MLPCKCYGLQVPLVYRIDLDRAPTRADSAPVPPEESLPPFLEYPLRKVYCSVCVGVLHLPLLSDRSCSMSHPVHRVGAHDLFRVEFCSRHASVTYAAPPHIARVCWTQDHCVRVMKAEGSEVVFQASTDAAVGALCAFSRSGEGIDQVRAR